MPEQQPEDPRESPPSGLWSFLGERYPRTWEWRDSLGCVWLVSLGIVLTVAILLGSVGVPSRAIQVGTVSALIVLVVVLWVIGRSGRADD